MFITTNLNSIDNIFNTLDNFVDRKERFKAAYSVNASPENYIIKVFLPGIKKEDISLKIEKGTSLIVSALRVKEESENTCIYDNICYGEIYTPIALPSFYFKEDCEAKFEEGILTIKLKSPTLKIQSNQINIL